MSFENLVLGFEPDPVFLGGSPVLHAFPHHDRNPLGRTENVRLLEAPNNPMRIIHGRFLRYLRSLEIKMPFATAFNPGNSSLTNVGRHRNSRFFYLLDLEKAFRCVQMERLAQILCEVDPRAQGMVQEAQAFLERYCASQFGGLAMGANSSQDLFNLYCWALLDKPFGPLCEQWGLTYTRYSDDLTFSWSHYISRRRFRRMRQEIREAITQAEFTAHSRKTAVVDLAKKPVYITGIGLELGGRIFVPWHYTRYLKRLLLEGLSGDMTLQPKIEGAMSVFRANTDRLRANQAQEEIFILYRRFRDLLQQS